MPLRVHFRRENVTLHVGEGRNLRQVCLDSGIDPYPVLGGLLSCRGKGFCGTCVVEVDPTEAVSPPAKREAKWLRTHARDKPALRLSCQASVTGDVTITTAPDTRPSWRTHSFYSGRVERTWEKKPASGADN